MERIPQIFKNSYLFTEHKNFGFQIIDQDSIQIDGKGFVIDGNRKVVHLLHIHNSNVLISNLSFLNGDTEVVKQLSRKEIYFRASGTFFDIIDGGAVLITGKSDVSFYDCLFEDNTALMCGGAISNQSSGKILFQGCTFKNNTAGHTGSAIDNLTIGSDLEVRKCIFINNKSNTWNEFNSPHGQITLFPRTSAKIIDCEFQKGSIPFDCNKDSKLQLSNNKYFGFQNWSENEIVIKKGFSIGNYLKTVSKLVSIIPKVLGRVRFKVNP